MATHIPHLVTYVYKEINVGKYKTVKRYELQETDCKNPKFSKLIRISKDQKYAKSSPCYWFDCHNGKTFVSPSITGLFKTEYNYIYYGDVDVNRVKTHTILFKFSKNGDTLEIKYFENYYTKDINSLIPFIK